MTAPDILRLEGLVKVFDTDLFRKKVAAVDDLTCRFPRGKVTGLLGPNGAGKTSTIRILFGLLQPDRGQVLFDGQPLTREHRRRIGYMPESNKLPGALTTTEFLIRQAALYGMSKRTATERAAKLLEDVGLAGQAKKRIAHLSKGMGRRLAWAQATMHEPELLVLDEPTSGLDIGGRELMRRWIRERKSAGVSMILCTHELEVMADICDDFHVLKGGRLAYSTLEDTHQAKGMSHLLRVSGLSAETAAGFRERHRLPAPRKVSGEGFMTALHFASYPEGSAWIDACLREGLVIVGFGEEPAVDVAFLKSFFQDEVR